MSITPVGGWGKEPNEGRIVLRDDPPSYKPSVVLIKETPRGSSFSRAFFGCLGVLFALWCVFFGPGFIDGFIKGFTKSFNEVQNTSPPVVETLRVSAPELNAAYQANEVAADEKYSHKTLRVFGLVKSIDKDALGSIHVRISDDAYFSGSLLGVDAKLRSGNEAIAADLYRGQGVAVRCPAIRYIIGTVMLDDCSFDSVERKQTPGVQSSATDDQPYNY